MACIYIEHSFRYSNRLFLAFIVQVLVGNKDNDSVVSNRLNQSITARFLRILPTKWNNRISLRMEIYGCPGTCLVYMIIT